MPKLMAVVVLGCQVQARRVRRSVPEPRRLTSLRIVQTSSNRYNHGSFVAETHTRREVPDCTIC